jgi:hypothetical protein
LSATVQQDVPDSRLVPSAQIQRTRKLQKSASPGKEEAKESKSDRRYERGDRFKG